MYMFSMYMSLIKFPGVWVTWVFTVYFQELIFNDLGKYEKLFPLKSFCFPILRINHLNKPTNIFKGKLFQEDWGK